MRYEDYKKLRDALEKNLDKLYIKRDSVQDFIYRTDGGTTGAKIKLAHIEELLNNLEKAINLCSWFMGEE